MTNVFRVVIILITMTIYFGVFKDSSLLFFVFLGLSIVIPEFIFKSKVKNRKKIRKNSPVYKTNQNKLSDRELRNAKLQTLSGTEFERLMEIYFRENGYEVKRIGGSGDHGVDLVIKVKEGHKIAVQCKRWENKNVGNEDVLKLKGGKQIHGCYDAWIITTSNFTKTAREAAELLRIRLINGLVLKDMLDEWKRSKQ